MKKNYLKLLLTSKNFTLKDLKAEAVLMMCHSILVQYFLAEEQNKNNDLLDKQKYFGVEDSKLIYNTMKEIFDYLSKTIISHARMEEIFENANKSKKELHKAKLLEPLAYFNDLLIKRFIAKLNEVTNKEKDWIPDLLVLCLIQYMKEKGYPFRKFPLIHNYNFDKLWEIYGKTNIIMKKEENIPLISKSDNKQKTIITKMEVLADSMINSLIAAKYKS